MVHPALDMYHYHVWANSVIMDRLLELPRDIYHKEIQSGFSSVAKVLSHIYQVDHTWFEIISGKTMKEAMEHSFQLGPEVEAKSLEEIKNRFVNLSDQWQELLASIEDMDQVMVVENPYAGRLETSVAETLLHVATHGAYHRGNIATMLRQMGHTSVMQDYGLYLYQK
ncbi:MAG TPA: DinB family protein [Bacillus sp. (in: firmicutes)]|uniref:DinB family protein n=1 Tax=Bacillus litorisediminis TaxID=2922713 RepID=UPI001FAE4755|nr:DinB family protein [Bacillus litorisediminis]HWO74550.1 DinB family protein [Bacillus sp. (in: firmicutes)]